MQYCNNNNGTTTSDDENEEDKQRKREVSCVVVLILITHFACLLVTLYNYKACNQRIVLLIFIFCLLLNISKLKTAAVDCAQENINKCNVLTKFLLLFFFSLVWYVLLLYQERLTSMDKVHRQTAGSETSKFRKCICTDSNNPIKFDNRHE